MVTTFKQRKMLMSGFRQLHGLTQEKCENVDSDGYNCQKRKKPNRG
jgi:hypothetical protein